MNISVVIPTYNRERYLKKCLYSLLVQKKLPYEIIVIDNANHNLAQDVVNNLKSKFDKKGIIITYMRNFENSGATARNLGVSIATGQLIAFLDDDVVLDDNYYQEIEKIFIKYPNALGVQGYDKKFYKSHNKIQNGFFNKAVYLFEKIFMIMFFFEKEKSRVLPSLCVTYPEPGFQSLLQSEWISTCAGVFSKSVFENYKFDSQLKKYSWNEYLDFSYSIFLENPKSLFITSKATYIDAQTAAGRLPHKELIYMSEVYDMYIFLKRFNVNYYNLTIYIWSKVGRIFYNIVKIIVRKPRELKLALHYLYAPLYVIRNLFKIKRGDLSFFNKTLT